MVTNTRIRTKIGNVLPSSVKQRILHGVFSRYASLAAVRAPYEYLFLLSHVRSGSSLLSLLLGNSPEICGYGETMLRYRSAGDLHLLTGNNLCRLQPWKLPGDERYMFDKLVFDDLLDPGQLPMLAEHDGKFIFLIREPTGVIRSMLASGRQDQTVATSLYVLRLSMLERYAGAMSGPGQALLLSYEDLIGRTDTVFGALSVYLELREPLKETYEVLPPMKLRTAARFRKMHYGVIDRGMPASKAVPIEPRNLDVAKRAYDRCWAALSKVSAVAANDSS